MSLNHRISSLVMSAVTVTLAATLSGCASGALLTSDLEMSGPADEKIWELEPDGVEVDLEKPDNSRVGTYRPDKGGIHYAAAGGGAQLRFERTQSNPLEVTVTDANGVIFRLRGEPDGDFNVTDAHGKLLCEIKARDYGYKTVDADGTERKIRVKRGGVSVRSADGRTVLSTDSTGSALVVTCLSLESVPMSVRGGLGLAVERWHD